MNDVSSFNKMASGSSQKGSSKASVLPGITSLSVSTCTFMQRIPHPACLSAALALLIIYAQSWYIAGAAGAETIGGTVVEGVAGVRAGIMGGTARVGTIPGAVVTGSTIAAVAGFLLAFVCLVLCFMVRREHKARVFAVCLSCFIGLYTGGCALRARAQQSVYCGLPLEHIRQATIVLTARSGKTAKGYYRFQGKLKKVSGSFAMGASARGVLTVVSDIEYIPGAMVLAPVTGAELAKGIVFLKKKDTRILKDANQYATVQHAVRTSIEAAIEQAAGKAAPLVKALLAGYRGDLENTSIKIFTDAGCAHILALSGQHVAVIVLLLGTVIRFVFGKRFEFGISAVALAFFAWITGASPSVVRAVLQFVLAGLFVWMGRPQKSIVVLSYTVLIAVWLFPESPFSLSFQLSYLAVTGIIVLCETMIFMFRRWIPYFAAKALAPGIAALGGTWLVGITVFGKINILSPLTSALVSPLITLLIVAGIVGSILVSIMPFAGVATRFLLEHAEQCVLFLIKLGSRAGMIYGGTAMVVFCLLACFAIVLYGYNWYQGKKFAINAKRMIADQLECYKAHMQT